jgi:hypothetical protein
MHIDDPQTQKLIFSLNQELLKKSLPFPDELIRKSVLIAKDYCVRSQIAFSEKDLFDKSIAILMDVKEGLEEIQQINNIPNVLRNAVLLEQKQAGINASNVSTFFEDEM